MPILPDHDDAGRSYCDAVAGILAKLTPPATVRVVELPALPPKGDIADWLDNLDAKKPDDLRQAVEAMADAAVEGNPVVVNVPPQTDAKPASKPSCSMPP